jgi:hypothetical protein
MPPASEYELALSMMRLWGKDARRSARDYALDCWRKDDALGFRRWYSVERIVEQMQAAPEPYAGTVSGVQLQRRVPIERRPRWLEKIAEMVTPALQRLGSSAIRAAGL